MGKPNSLLGRRFGRLVVVGRVHRREYDKSAWWSCLCSCGNTTEVRAQNLRSGATTSCGCYKRDFLKKRKPFNEHRVKDGVVYITLRQRNGNVFTSLVDEEDLSFVSRHRWSPMQTKGKPHLVYVGTRVDGKTERLHRMLLGDIPDGLTVDHINGDTLDNRRSNLRLCSKAQNNMNRSTYKNNTSGYRGVYRCGRRWRAAIAVNGSMKHLGVFSTKEEASDAYWLAANNIYGEFARFE